MIRSLGISVLSLALTSIVIANAYYQKKQFYPSVVYITKSNPSMAVIYIQAFICVWIIGKLMKKIFFGQLRTTEFEHLMERSWYAITETCLAFTVFRDDFNPKFVALFTLLLFLKSFHWLAEDRVDYMERSPVISWLFHIRVLSLLVLLAFLDVHFIAHAYHSTVTKGASVQLVFGFEYAILFTVVINIAIKYALHSVDLNSETPWDNKAVFLLYTELVMGLIKVVLYVAFVAIMVRIYTLPLFAFRPMYHVIRNFKKAFSDVILSRRAIHNMNTLYPDATPEELQAADNVCIICREEMTTASKKLPCNHIFHTSCLRSWFQRQQTCPTCRLNILRTPASAETRQPPAGGPVPRQMPPPNPFMNPLFAGVHRFFNQPNLANLQQQPNQGAANIPPNVGNIPPPAMPPFVPPQMAGAMPGGGAVPPTSGHNQQQQAPPVIPPFAFPPFPFMPFMAPPPMPPQNMANFSAEELRRMEGGERENVEARIQCLRNIQVLLDTSIVMMQQYSAAAAISTQTPQGSFHVNIPQPTESTAQNSRGGSPASPIDSTTNTAEVDVSSNATSCNGTTGSTTLPPGPSGETPDTDNVTSGSSSSNVNNCKSSSQINGVDEETPSQSVSYSQEEEIRRRRLQRFQQQQEEEQQ